MWLWEFSEGFFWRFSGSEGVGIDVEEVVGCFCDGEDDRLVLGL